MLTSVHDLVKWDEALYGEQLLSAESKTAMWTSAVLPNGDTTGYAFGWSVGQYRGLTSQSHGGQVAGFVASFSRLPEQEAAFFVFLNRYRPPGGRLRTALLHTFMPSLGPIP